MNYLCILNKCNLCIRNCNVNRNNTIGFCKSSSEIKIARAELHMWEEPCISGNNGSGTVFFSNCNMRCVYCQNHNISQGGIGKSISIERLSDIFLELQNKGAHNINLVTPTHYVPQIIEALKLAKDKGLNLPIVYNTNSMDSTETIKMLDGYIDVYLPDYKYFNDKYSEKYSGVTDYSENAIKVIDEMVKQVGLPQFNNEGMMIKGVIVRHLLLPSLLFDSKKVIDILYDKFKDSIYISLMNQYIPAHNAHNFSEINKPLSEKVYNSLIDYALDIGVKNGFIQGEGTSSTKFIPKFDFTGV